MERYKEIRPHIESALGGVHAFVEIDVTDNTSDLRRLQMNFVPDIDDDGEVQGFYAVGIDVTAWKR